MIETKHRLKDTSSNLLEAEARYNPLSKDNNTKPEKVEIKVRLNLTLRGEAARALYEMKAKGIIRSYADGVNQAILLFYDKIIRQDLLSARLKALEKGFDENEFVGTE